jgi:ParB-like chromosome segregation protein Spo0J
MAANNKGSQLGGIPERVSVKSLKEFPGNARRGDVKLIAESLQRRSQYKPLVVSSDDVVLAGNHTLRAAQSLGWTEVDIWRLNLRSDDSRATEIVLADNRISDLASFDDAALLELLESLPELDASGYSDHDLNELLKQIADEPLPEPGDASIDDLAVAWGVVIDCDSEEQQTDLIGRFLDEGLKVRAIM